MANTAWYLYNFRRGLLQGLLEEGWDVVAVCPRDSYVEQLEELGVRWVAWKLDRAGMSPLRDSRSIAELGRVYRDEQPDVVHHFTIKSVLYGTKAAERAGISRVVNSVTGLGHVFISPRLTARCVRPWIRRWYLRALTKAGSRPIFQNADDLAVLARHSMRLAERSIMANGSGVNLERFAPVPKRELDQQTRILFVGRLIAEKGIFEFLEAARILHERGVATTFHVCGAPDPGNPSSIDDETLAQWESEGIAEFAGHVDDVAPLMSEADVVALPSYREGTPRVLLEAGAMALPVVATDVPGCRDVVKDGVNGLLVPTKSPESLAAAIETLACSPELRHRLGQAGQTLVEGQYDEKKVVQQTLGVYHSICAETPGNESERPVEKGTFVFSLDFELAWGTRGRPAAQHCQPFWDGTREAIFGLLDLFEKHEFPATWATVGALLLGQSDSRRHEWLDEAQFHDVPIGTAASQPDWYAEDIVERLRTHPVAQEIGCHTLTHRFIEPGTAGREQFRQELRRFRQLCGDLYIEQPTSFIFPKAKMAHFDVLAEEGFTSIRGPEPKWFESLPTAILPAVARLVDAKLSRPPNVGLPRQLPCGLWVIPSSQFYSPFMSVGNHVSVEQRVAKAIKGLRLAANRRQIFHLWTHPFNLGVRTAELLHGLDEILAEARRLCAAGQLQIQTMGQLTSCLQDAAQKLGLQS